MRIDVKRRKFRRKRSGKISDKNYRFFSSLYFKSLYHAVSINDHQNYKKLIKRIFFLKNLSNEQLYRLLKLSVILSCAHLFKKLFKLKSLSSEYKTSIKNYIYSIKHEFIKYL